MEVIMFQANSLNRIKRYFRNNDGPIKCVINGENKRIISTLAEAEEFFKFVQKDADKLMAQLEAIEQSIKADKEYIRKFQPGLNVPEDQLKSTYNLDITHIQILKWINIYQKSIEEKQEHIKNIVKNNPNIEPLWIMKKICE